MIVELNTLKVVHVCRGGNVVLQVVMSWYHVTRIQIGVYPLKSIQCVIQYCSVVFSIIKYCEFSDIKELVDQVFSDRQLAHGIAVGTTIILEVPPRSPRTEPQCPAYQNCLNSKETIPNL